ncbi:MAG: hypothetical protein V4792_09980 [Pseudomonadota bacterium]
MLRSLLITCAVVALSGCSTLGAKIDNRVSCTLGGDKMLYTSMWGWVGVTSEVDARDAAQCAKAAQ